MNGGQWIGEIDGTNKGVAILSIDGDRPHAGFVQIAATTLPFNAGAMLVHDGDKIRGQLGGFFTPYNQNATLPQTGEFERVLATDNSFTGQWSTSLGTQGTMSLVKTDEPEHRSADLALSWQEFTRWAFDRTTQGSIFRGHGDARHPLLTSFHRVGRRNLWRYILDDIPRLNRFVEGALSARIRLDDPVDYGRLLGLAQHHGYPTPLLDWTESPFVAAYFAFASLSKIPDPHGPSTVRIFMFEPLEWPYGWGGADGQILDPAPRVAVREFSAGHNVRAMPQQSIHVFSNVVDIEEFVALVESGSGKKYLTRIDVPASERSSAMRDLHRMGISAASLFPGLDGLCRSLGERYF